jgi:hypothetical protein
MTRLGYTSKKIKKKETKYGVRKPVSGVKTLSTMNLVILFLH